MRGSNSPACKYFEKIFQKDIKELDATIYFQLSFVEHSYQAVYKDQFATMKRKQGIAFLEDSIAFTKEVLKDIKIKTTNENVEEYLYVRIADFYFNLGYVYEFRREYEEMQNCYQNTLENYKCVAKMEHWSKDIVDEIIKRYTKENINMRFFILNTVAESGSMIISSIINGAPNYGYANQTQELIEMSFNAFTHITDYLSQILKRKEDIEIIPREVYFRNFYEFLRRVEQISQHNGGKAVLNLDHQQIVSKELELVQNGMAIIYSGKNEDPPRYKSYKESIDCYLAIIDDENYYMSINEKLKLLEKAYIYSGDALRKFSQLPEFRKIRAQICVKLNEVMYQKGVINRQMAYLTEACELIEEYRQLSSCGLNMITEIKEK